MQQIVEEEWWDEISEFFIKIKKSMMEKSACRLFLCIFIPLEMSIGCICFMF